MKKLPLCALLAFAAFAFAIPAINAAEGDGAAPPPRRARIHNDGNGATNGPRANFPKLSQEERQKLRAAVTKARDDADVKKAQERQKKAHDEFLAAQKKYNEALKAAVLKEDPSLKETVEKFKDAPLPGARGAFGERRGGPGGERPAAGRAPRRGAKPAKEAPSADNV
ncbi:MAG: hypothetical protein LBG65_06265 [Puniceicoccales bacterium]|jgi:Spy/CpxP family protein refolding chaperone|nr:hypothetical protein [Puniceicoccales bacterium]